LGKAFGGQGPIEGEVRRRHRAEVGVEQLAEDRLLVVEVVIDVPLRYARVLGDVAHARCAVPTVREELQRRIEDLPAASFGALFLVHDELSTSQFMPRASAASSVTPRKSVRLAQWFR